MSKIKSEQLAREKLKRLQQEFEKKPANWSTINLLTREFGSAVITTVNQIAADASNATTFCPP